MIIAIDGPAGSGKSTIASRLAERLGFCKLDTGAMYRSCAWAALERGIDLDDQEALGKLAHTLDIKFAIAQNSPASIFVDGVDVTNAIRTPRIDRNVSRVAACPAVRQAMLAVQRNAALGANIIAEGRDIGTVVFPNADLKIFMTADPRQRAIRRVLQRYNGVAPDQDIFDAEVESTLADICMRDAADSSRQTAPLVAAEDAIHIDSSTMTIEEVLDRIVALVQER